MYIFIVLCIGESKAPPVLYLSYSTVYMEAHAIRTARHVITVIVLAFLTQENEACKMQSTINQLKHGKGRAVRDNGTRGVVLIDRYCTYSTSFGALTNTYSTELSVTPTILSVLYKYCLVSAVVGPGQFTVTYH